MSVGVHRTYYGPGLHKLDEAVYHSDPTEHGSLSVTRAKVLLAEGGPAKYRHICDHPPAPKPQFILGKAAHEVVLGGGADIVVVEADNWRARTAQTARDEALNAGRTPLLPAEWDQVRAMADALIGHDLALQILTQGESEVSAFAEDPTTGVMLRGRFDHLGPDMIGDYKTCVDASPAAFRKAAYAYGYHIQAAWYRRLAQLLDLGDLPFWFIAQEKTAPYLVSVFDLDDTFLNLGRVAMDEAISLYTACTRSGEWPGYSPDLVTLSPPPWVAPTPQPIPDDLLAELDELNQPKEIA